MKLLILAAILGAIILPIYGQETGEHPNAQQQKGDSAPTPNNRPSPPDTINVSTVNVDTETDHNEVPKCCTAVEWSNWALVLVGIITCWAIWKQANYTALAAEMGAKSAKRNTEVLIASERAWVLVDHIQPPYLQPIELTPTNEQRFAHCIFFLKNFGKAPATIVASHFELQVTDSRTGPPNVTFYDVLPGTPQQIPYIIPPGSEPMPHEADLTPEGFMRVTLRDEIITQKSKFLWLFGIVRYFDFKEAEKRETRFCFMYETWLNTPEPFWKPAGSLTLNQVR